MRVLTILFAYTCAVVVALFLIVLLGVLESGETFIPSVSDLRIAGLFVLAAAIYALPIALPVIIATEARKWGNWKIFIGAGAILGVLLTVLFTAVPFELSNLRFSAIFLPIATVAAFVYWAVAWKLMPPTKRASSPPGGMSE